MSYVTSIIVMVYHYDRNLKKEIETGFYDDLCSSPRDFRKIDMGNSGGTKNIEADIYACGANYLDFQVFREWITGLSKKYNAKIMVAYNTEGDNSGAFALNANPYSDERVDDGL